MGEVSPPLSPLHPIPHAPPLPPTHPQPFSVDPRYTGLKHVGGGAYGVVVSADDATTGRRVAVKKCRDVFRDLTDAKRILRELKLLRLLGAHENLCVSCEGKEAGCGWLWMAGEVEGRAEVWGQVPQLLPIPPAAAPTRFPYRSIWVLDAWVWPNTPALMRDVYIVTDLMETDLSRIIDSPQPLTPAHVKVSKREGRRGGECAGWGCGERPGKSLFARHHSSAAPAHRCHCSPAHVSPAHPPPHPLPAHGSTSRTKCCAG